MAAAKKYMIEHGKFNNRWLVRVETAGRGSTGEQTCTYSANGAQALLFNKKDAVAFAKKWKVRAWETKNGLPVKQVWPE